MRIIGITGTIGAGKGTIVEYLTNHYHFRHYSVRAYLIEEIKRRGLGIDRDSMVLVANDLRANHSPSFIVDQLFDQAKTNGQDAIIESIRTPGEIHSLREKGNFILLAVDAKPELRYQRIIVRNSETDNITFETFLENEKREMETSDPNKQNLSECIKQADFVLRNDHNFQFLFTQVDEIIKSI
ncbi:AAA family ATPase [Bacteroidales bacterium OttesenSCG-928-B11]|nr:AAA family ATPase [Bacteroidales bacterium OttesenSCG-928-E04]MDL2312516.1 AAA family ATPase [Bacteroidales bacterium OttesenSCG-928-B11]